MRLGGSSLNEGRSSALFVGIGFASLYVGNERVPTVPDRPTITLATIFVDPDPAQGNELYCEWTAPENDGGTPVFNYSIFLNGTFVDVLEEPETLDATLPLGLAFVPGDVLTITASNAVGEGLDSFPVVTAAT
jgi:hypothetical protein